MRSKGHQLSKIISDAAFHCHLAMVILSQFLSASLLNSKTALLLQIKTRIL